MIDIRRQFLNLSRSKTTWQAGTLYLSTLIGVAIGFGASVANTRLLGEEGYGQMTWMMNLFLLTATLMSFGIPHTCGNLLAQPENQDKRSEILGGAILITLVFSALIALGLLAFSFLIEPLFGNGLSGLVRWCTPFLFAFPFQLLLVEVLKGDNRIFRLSVLQLSPRTLYLLGTFLVVFLIHYSGLLDRFSVGTSWVIRLITWNAVIVMEIIVLRPVFRHWRGSIALIWRQNKKYGVHVYTGMIANVATAQLAPIMVG
ncbi:oligosaccharide flippase family protein, partial [bacterium]|nr:oligosaccharide flippase family protein [bacterium]